MFTQIFALLVEPYVMIRTSVSHRTGCEFRPGNFCLFRRNPWQPLAEARGSAQPRSKNTGLHLRSTLPNHGEHADPGRCATTLVNEHHSKQYDNRKTSINGACYYWKLRPRYGIIWAMAIDKVTLKLHAV